MVTRSGIVVAQGRPIQGTVDSADKEDMEGLMGTWVLRICLVEGVKGQDPALEDADKVRLFVTDKTKVEKAVGTECKPASLEELVKGAQVEFEYSKDIGVLESNPPTVYATTVVIREAKK